MYPVEDDSQAFDYWLAKTLTLGPEEREARLVAWATAPSARAAHTRVRSISYR